jgi:glutaredoxin 3
MKKVRLFTTPVCAYCITLKSFLKEKGIEFEEIDVSSDEKAADEMVERSGQMGVPVLDIEGEIIVGFDKEKILKSLNISE